MNNAVNYFIPNRDLIKGLKFNTGTSTAPAFTEACTATEITLNTDFEQQDFYTFCDSIQRSLITGVAMSIDTTIRFDVNNTAIQGLLGKIHTLLTEGTIAQFNNEVVQFDLLKDVSEGVLTYTTYQVPVVLNFSELGGAAEDASEFGLTIVINGKGSVVTG